MEPLIDDTTSLSSEPELFRVGRNLQLARDIPFCSSPGGSVDKPPVLGLSYQHKLNISNSIRVILV